MRLFAAWIAVSLPTVALGYVDPKCEGTELPGNYDEQAQQDFLQNYPALASSYSPMHAPIPHKPGRGSIGLELAAMPPLGCARRLVLQGTKTEDTNKTPVIPRPRVTFAFPAIGGLVVPYAGFAFVPPVKLFGTTNVILSGELGLGVPIGDTLQVGARYHHTLHRTVGEIATPFNIEDPAFDDLYLASTFGLDAMLGFDLGEVVPYVAVGYLDVSSFFFIGDDAFVANNYHPYSGLALSAGIDGLIKDRIRVGAEFYAAPGGHSRPDKSVPSIAGFGRYGQLYTGRLKLAIEL